jgi:tetratricopeptide (TPR) repeat protein
MKLKQFLSVTAAAVIIFALMVVYYYVKTPAAAIVVSCDDFPPSLSLSFSTDALIDRVVNHLQDMISAADSGVINELGRREGLGPRAVAQKVLPITASSRVPSPVFDQKWKGVDLNFARRLGIYLKTKKLLELRVIGAPQNGWRILAFAKERPVYSPQQTGTAPRGGGQCSDFESCANDVAEQTLRFLDPARLLNYYIKLDTESSNRQILDLYQNVISAKSTDDLVAWGNAYFALHRYDDALQKYQEALGNKDEGCAARIARGFLYYGRPHGKQLLSDLRLAEQDFRWGVNCDSKNKFAHTDLCNTLIREWANSNSPSIQLLQEAQDHCGKALESDPRFVIAAVNIAYSLYRQGKHNESIAYFDTISQQYPTDSALFANYGYFLYLGYLSGKKDNLRAAIEKTEQAFKLDPESYAAANNLGFFYYEDEEYQRALAFWEKADPLRGDDADAVAGQALALFKLNREQDGILMLQKAVSLNALYRDPTFLKKHNDWSDRAAADLAILISKLPS